MADELKTVLNFKAKLVSEHPEDRRRQFMISFYLCDETIAIFEANVPNSGFHAGKFLQRTRIRNPDTNKFFEATAFYVGAKVRACGRIFDLVDAAPHTFVLMEENKDIFPDADIDYVMNTVKNVAGDINFRASFEAKDPIKCGVVMKDEAEEILKQLDGKMTKHAVITLLRAYTDGNKYNYKPLLEFLKQ